MKRSLLACFSWCNEKIKSCVERRHFHAEYTGLPSRYLAVELREPSIEYASAVLLMIRDMTGRADYTHRAPDIHCRSRVTSWSTHRMVGARLLHRFDPFGAGELAQLVVRR